MCGSRGLLFVNNHGAPWVQRGRTIPLWLRCRLQVCDSRGEARQMRLRERPGGGPPAQDRGRLGRGLLMQRRLQVHAKHPRSDQVRLWEAHPQGIAQRQRPVLLRVRRHLLRHYLRQTRQVRLRQGPEEGRLTPVQPASWLTRPRSRSFRRVPAARTKQRLRREKRNPRKPACDGRLCRPTLTSASRFGILQAVVCRKSLTPRASR